jgi:outer membrane protein assembly factor BamE (lipoprotein component of BamABCDE complex)
MKMRRYGVLGASAAVLCCLVGCMSAQDHQAAVSNTDKNRVTAGVVQREIRVGMSGDEVIAVLGSPNVVTTDEQRRESWVYDKFSTETVYSSSSSGVSALIFGGGPVDSGIVGGGVGPSYRQSAGARSTTQRTLTVVIKFDASKRVRDFAYRQSSF